MAFKTRYAFGLAAVILVAAANPLRAGPNEDSFAIDEQGRRFRIRFDPASRIGLGLSTVLDGDSQALEPALELRIDLSIRSALEFVEEEETIRWWLEHRILDSRLRPAASPGAVPGLDLTAYRGSYRRHSENPTLILPTDPPQRLYFPFDIGLQFDAGRLEMQSEDLLRLGIVKAAVLLDPWRTGEAGNSLELGLGVRYCLDLLGDSGLAAGQVIHRVAPFSDFSARFRYQDRSGLTVIDVEASAFPHWASSGGWTTGFEGRASFQRVLIGINDQPLAVVVETSYRNMGNPKARIMLTAGLQLGFQL